MIHQPRYTLFSFFFTVRKWNTTGVNTTIQDDGSVLVKTTHLTSFAILVSGGNLLGHRIIPFTMPQRLIFTAVCDLALISLQISVNNYSHVLYQHKIFISTSSLLTICDPLRENRPIAKNVQNSLEAHEV